MLGLAGAPEKSLLNVVWKGIGGLAFATCNFFHCAAFGAFHSSAGSGRLSFTSAFIISGGTFHVIECRLKKQKTINFVRLSPSCLIQSSHARSSTGGVKSGLLRPASRTNLAKMLWKAKASRSNSRFFSHVAKAVRRRRAWMDPIWPASSGADVSPPDVYGKGLLVGSRL